MDWLYFLIYMEVTLFIFLVSSIFYLYFFYKRNSNKLESSFQLLINKGHLTNEDYAFYDSLGFWGVGFKVSILNMLLKGKRVKVKDGRYLDYQARTYLVKNADNDLRWISSFYNIFKVQISITISFLVCVFITSKMGV